MANDERIQQRPTARRFGAEAIPVFLAFALSNASNFSFHLVISRLVGPAAYGQLAAVLSLVFIVSVPVGVIQSVAAKRVALNRVAAKPVPIHSLLGPVAKAMLFVAGVFGLGVLLAAPLLANSLRMPAGPVALIGPYLIFSLLSGLAFGALQGNLRFWSISVALIISVSVRLVLGVGLAYAGFGVTGAMLATVAASLVSAGVAMTRADLLPHKWLRAKALISPYVQEIRSAVLGLGVIAILVQIDLVLARRYLPSAEAGLYSAAGLIARTVLFVPGVVALVAFPRFAEVRGEGRVARRWLHLSALGVMAIAAVLIPGLVVARTFIVSTVFGSGFEGAADFVPILSVGMLGMALATLLMYFHLAAETFAYRFAMVALCGELIGLFLAHNSAYQVSMVVLLTSVVAVALLYKSAIDASRRFERAPATSARADAHVELSVVLPCYNAAAGLRSVLTELCDEVLPPESSEIIVVSDGSTDDTASIARSFASRVNVIEHERRQGKGDALRSGLAVARGRFVAFIDSDGDIRPANLRPMIAIMSAYDPDLVLASKRHPMSVVAYPKSRRLMSWTYHKVARLLFRINVRDTQTGLKVFRREVLERVLPLLLEKRFAFDLEFLVVSRLLGYSRVFEAPVRIDFQFESHVDARQTARIVLDTLAIFYRRYFLGTYHQMLARSREPQTVAERGTPMVISSDASSRGPAQSGTLPTAP